MKKLFTVIRQGKLDEAARILDRKPELIACTATAPPKKDHGQSPLMVAIKSDNLEVAHLLLDRGADVNFRDEPNPYGFHSFSAPIWYDAIVQCFLRAGDNVSDKSKERTRQYYELLRRLLHMGMNPNQKAVSDLLSRNAWQVALDQYDEFALSSYSSHYLEGNQAHNRQLREMLKKVLDLLLAHGVDIHDHEPPERFRTTTCILLRNLEEGRELFDGFHGLDPAELKPYTVKYRGKEHTIQPMAVDEQLRRYEVKWLELEPVLRAYYE